MNNLKPIDKIIAYTSSHDTGAITAHQSHQTEDENQIRNRRLMAKLMLKNYDVSSIKGSYIENNGSSNEKEIAAEIFFVVDLKNKGVLRIDLGNLGQEFGLDSVLIIPKGSDISYHLETEFLSKVRFRPFVFSEEITEHQSPTNVMGKWAAGLASK
jgi:hypothetical protein